MYKFKTLDIENFCGFEKATFNIDQQAALFFGPNGFGKSSILNGMRMLSCPAAIAERPTEDPSRRFSSNELLLKGLVYDPDYDPTYENMRETKVRRDMKITGTFIDESGDLKKVTVGNSGIILNELPNLHGGHAYFVDADSPMSIRSFQIQQEASEKFLDLTESIYGFECGLLNLIREPSHSQTVSDRPQFYTDFVIHKKKTVVHYKKMSAGEKKIATMLRLLCSPTNTGSRRMVLIDNAEMHIYWNRHTKLWDKLLEHFPQHQLIMTTHSGEIIRHAPSQCQYDLEKMT